MGSAAVPVTSLDASMSINTAVASILKRDGRGVGVRARLEHIMKPRFGALLAVLMKTIGAEEQETDLIVDLGAPNYEPYEDFADGLVAAMDNIGDVSGYRSFVLTGSAYPESITFDKPGGRMITGRDMADEHAFDFRPYTASDLLGHTKLESTVRYLGIEVDDALAISEQVGTIDDANPAVLAIRAAVRATPGGYHSHTRPCRSDGKPAQLGGKPSFVALRWSAEVCHGTKSLRYSPLVRPPGYRSDRQDAG
jgi:Beta protein